MTEPSKVPNPFRDLDTESMPIAKPADYDAANPYTSPRAELGQIEQPIGLWRDGELLVVHEQAAFPPRCPHDNEPAGTTIVSRLLWSYPIDWYRRTASFSTGVCQNCLRRRIRVRGWGALLVFLGFGLIVGVCSGVLSPIPRAKSELVVWLVFIGASLIPVGLHLITRPYLAWKISQVHRPYFWIAGVQADYLKELPAWGQLDRSEGQIRSVRGPDGSA